MVSEDRQRIIEVNRSLRLIKNELESLLEKGVLTEETFDSITSLLPTESSISSSSRAGAPGKTTPAVAAALNNKLSNLHLGADDHRTETAPPPSYTQSTGGGGPPPLPGRKSTAPPPPPPPSKPIIAHARALYAYAATDSRDCSFERDDRLDVYEYMNADWWMGRNLRTGQEGIFPKSYVELEQQQQQTPSNPYDSHVPPQAMANQEYSSGDSTSKVEENGKKFGKKLGNAAIFGAGATLGGKIVNSIF